jgi:hypothetical protein
VGSTEVVIYSRVEIRSAALEHRQAIELGAGRWKWDDIAPYLNRTRTRLASLTRGVIVACWVFRPLAGLVRRWGFLSFLALTESIGAKAEMPSVKHEHEPRDSFRQLYDHGLRSSSPNLRPMASHLYRMHSAVRPHDGI